MKSNIYSSNVNINVKVVSVKKYPLTTDLYKLFCESMIMIVYKVEVF